MLITIFVRLALAIIVVTACLVWAARADDETAIRQHYFAAAKNATLVNGSKGVNYCGEYDAVKVRLLGMDQRTGLIHAEIIDVMRSAHGRVGDVVRVHPGKTTVGLYSPFAEPIVFINSTLDAYCISGPSGG